MNKEKFTLEKALEVQYRQIEKMDIYCKPEVMVDVRRKAREENILMIDNIGIGEDINPYAVWRGGSMTSWVENNTDKWSATA